MSRFLNSDEKLWDFASVAGTALYRLHISTPCWLQRWLVACILEVCIQPTILDGNWMLTIWTELPPDTQKGEVETLFEKYGKIVDVRLMTGLWRHRFLTFVICWQNRVGFGFVEYESSRVSMLWVLRSITIDDCLGRMRKMPWLNSTAKLSVAQRRHFSMSLVYTFSCQH